MNGGQRPNDPNYIKAHARNLRRLLGIDESLSPNLNHVLFQYKTILPDFTLEVIPDSKSALLRAAADTEKSILFLAARTLRGIQYNDPDDRFVIGHELGHFALHTGAQAHMTKSALVRSINWQSEREANTFAVAFLAPDYLAKDFKSVDEIQKLFQIPRGIAKRLLAENDNGPERIGGKSLPLTVAQYLREQNEKGYEVTALPLSNVTLNIGSIGHFTGNLGVGNASGPIDACSTDYRAVRELVLEVRRHANQLVGPNLESGQLQIILAKLETALEHDRPNSSVIRSVLEDLRGSVSGAAGNLISAGVLHVINQILGTGVPAP